MKIEKIVIACFKKDIFLLRTCVASIRYWYPEIDILLLKDTIKGDFSLHEFETFWNCKIFPTTLDKFGWPWSKLAVLLEAKRNRYLFLDSDIVLLGPILDVLNTFQEDFVVTGVEIQDENNPLISRDYIDMEKIKHFDAQYQYPGYGFNGGQIVMTSGIFTKEYLSSAIDFGDKISNKRPDIFKHGDQGCLNYLFTKAAMEQKISLRYHDFWIWPGVERANEIDLLKIIAKEGYPYLMHWAGIKPVDFRKYLRYDLIQFYENYYYSVIPLGKIKQYINLGARLILIKLKIIKYKILGQKYE